MYSGPNLSVIIVGAAKGLDVFLPLFDEVRKVFPGKRANTDNAKKLGLPLLAEVDGDLNIEIDIAVGLTLMHQRLVRTGVPCFFIFFCQIDSLLNRSSDIYLKQLFY